MKQRSISHTRLRQRPSGFSKWGVGGGASSRVLVRFMHRFLGGA